jgi:hypothetical protein
MAYTKPPYLIDQEIGDTNLHYIWDDTRASADFKHDGEWLPERVQGVHLTGRISLGIGIYEWIVWRFQPLTDDPGPGQLAEAAWCATVHPAYMEFALFDRDEWTGPIRGPLWGAQTWLVPMARCDTNSVEECESGLAYLYSLAMHVLPTTTAFESWLGGCIERLVDLYAAPEEDPFTGLFRDPIEGRGPLVAPPLLDLSVRFDPQYAKVYMSRFLAAGLSSSNPFLLSPEEMREAGFTGTPYMIRDVNGG